MIVIMVVATRYQSWFIYLYTHTHISKSPNGFLQNDRDTGLRINVMHGDINTAAFPGNLQPLPSIKGSRAIFKMARGFYNFLML